MILFFQAKNETVYALSSSKAISKDDKAISKDDQQKLSWLFSEANFIDQEKMDGYFVGPRKEMITPWSTNAVEITQNMGISGIFRIEEYFPVKGPDAQFDPMLQHMYEGLDQTIFTIDKEPDPIVHIDDIAAYNKQEGLALSGDEIAYREEVSIAEIIRRAVTEYLKGGGK